MAGLKNSSTHLLIFRFVRSLAHTSECAVSSSLRFSARYFFFLPLFGCDKIRSCSPKIILLRDVSQNADSKKTKQNQRAGFVQDHDESVATTVDRFSVSKFSIAMCSHHHHHHHQWCCHRKYCCSIDTIQAMHHDGMAVNATNHGVTSRRRKRKSRIISSISSGSCVRFSCHYNSVDNSRFCCLAVDFDSSCGQPACRADGARSTRTNHPTDPIDFARSAWTNCSTTS